MLFISSSSSPYPMSGRAWVGQSEAFGPFVVKRLEIAFPEHDSRVSFYYVHFSLFRNTPRVLPMGT